MKKEARQKTMFNTKNTISQNIHGNEAAYFGTVTTVTPKTIVVFIPALDVEVDIQHNPTALDRNACKEIWKEKFETMRKEVL